MPTLFDPLSVGELELARRVVMAPLTRSRASPGQLPNELMRQYYAQRADPATGAWMVNNGHTRTMALNAVASGAADLVAFGKAFIANPDLGRRLREDAPLNSPDTTTFYGGGAAGYTDFPTLDAALA